jgi:hypothetical protein
MCWCWASSHYSSLTCFASVRLLPSACLSADTACLVPSRSRQISQCSNLTPNSLGPSALPYSAASPAYQPGQLGNPFAPYTPSNPFGAGAPFDPFNPNNPNSPFFPLNQPKSTK